MSLQNLQNPSETIYPSAHLPPSTRIVRTDDINLIILVTYYCLVHVYDVVGVRDVETARKHEDE